jgi:hypothetical protein
MFSCEIRESFLEGWDIPKLFSERSERAITRLTIAIVAITVANNLWPK